MTSMTERISDMYAVVELLGLKPEEYKELAKQRLSQIDVTEFEFPELKVACDIFSSRLADIFVQNMVNTSFGSNKEIEKVRSVFSTDTFDVKEEKVNAKIYINAKYSNNIVSEYNSFVGLLGETYWNAINKKYIKKDVEELEKCFANDFFILSSQYLLENGIDDINTRIQTRRLNVDDVVAIVSGDPTSVEIRKSSALRKR